MEACAALGAFVPFMMMFVAIFAFSRFVSGWHETAMKQAAKDFGLEFQEGRTFGANCQIRGMVGDTDVHVDSYTSGSGKNKSTWTRFRLNDPRVMHDVQLSGEGVFSFIGKAFKGADVQIGDKAFDDAVLLRGDNRAAMFATLDAPSRVGIRRAISANWSLQNGEWLCRKSGRMRDGNAIRSVIAGGLKAVEASRRYEGSLHEGLANTYRNDSNPQVRAKALQERLILKPALTPEELRPLTEDPGWMGLVAANAMGVDGLPALHEALTTGDPVGVRIQAAELLCQRQNFNGIDGAAVQRVLLQAVAHEPWIDRAIKGLAQVGTVDAVGPLLEHANGFLPSARKTSAQDAIRQIQSRLAGADRGQLAIVEARGGELSEAEAPRLRPGEQAAQASKTREN